MAASSCINEILPEALDFVGERVLGDRSVKALIGETSFVGDIVQTVAAGRCWAMEDSGACSCGC